MRPHCSAIASASRGVASSRLSSVSHSSRKAARSARERGIEAILHPSGSATTGGNTMEEALPPVGRRAGNYSALPGAVILLTEKPRVNVRRETFKPVVADFLAVDGGHIIAGVA